MQTTSRQARLTQRRARPAIVALSVLCLALLHASPAAAASAGTGQATGSGFEEEIITGEDFGNPPTSFCLEVETATYVAEVTGAYTAVDDTTSANAGPATITFTTERHFIGPEGAYEDTGGTPCATGTLGGPIQSTVTVSSPVITCEEDDNGEYRRVTNTIAVTWNGECEVTDLLTSDVNETGNTNHVLTAEAVPCLQPEDPNEPSVPPGCTRTELVGVTWSYVGGEA